MNKAFTSYFAIFFAIFEYFSKNRSTFESVLHFEKSSNMAIHEEKPGKTCIKLTKFRAEPVPPLISTSKYTQNVGRFLAQAANSWPNNNALSSHLLQEKKIK